MAKFNGVRRVADEKRVSRDLFDKSLFLIRDMQDWHLTIPLVSRSYSVRMGTNATATVPTTQRQLHSLGEPHHCVAYGLPQRVKPSGGQRLPIPSKESARDYRRSHLRSSFSHNPKVRKVVACSAPFPMWCVGVTALVRSAGTQRANRPPFLMQLPPSRQQQNKLHG